MPALRLSCLHRLCLFLVTTASLAAAAAQAQSPPYIFGVLQADPQHLQTDYNAGVRLAEVAVGWDRYEPEPGKYNVKYRNELAAKIHAYHDAGYMVVVGVGLQYTPAWIKNNPNLQHQSQFPGDVSHLPNLVFNQPLRDITERYIKDAVTHLGPVDYYRVGLSHNGETLYPEAPNQEWWAFDPMAQGDAPGRPASIPAPPLPHWVPGTLYQGRQVTREEAERWYDWYLNALVDAHDWEIRAHRNAGFQGPIQLPMPGLGVRPDFYRKKIDSLLAPSPSTTDHYHVMNTAAVWFLFLDKLKERNNIVVDISSIYDNSGKPRGDDCNASDDRVDYLHDPQIDQWSSARWISLHARRNGFLLIGENPGHNDVATMQNVFRLMASCHLTGLMWAFDRELYDGTDASLNDYAGFIHLYNGR